MPLQRPTTGVCHALLRIPTQSGPRLQCCGFPHKVAPFALCGSDSSQRMSQRRVTKTGHKDRSHPHSNEYVTQPIAYLISKQVISYRTRGGTCCPGGLLLRFGP
jgi:hypothetical protein